MTLIALTGATGFIGSHVIKRLVADGHHVHALVRGTPTLTHPDLTWIRGNLDDGPALRELVAGSASVIHLAGTIRGAHYSDFSAVNVGGTRQLIEAVADRAPRAHVVMVSSLAATAPQLSDYAASKRAGEALVEAASAQRGITCSIIRPPAVYGPDDPALAPLWRALARGWLLRAGPANGRFSLLHVDDLTEALVRLARRDRPAQRILAMDDGHPGGYGWPTLAAVAARQRAGKVRTIAIPRRLLLAAAHANVMLAPLLRKKPLLTPGKVAELSHPAWVCDNVGVYQTLDWTPQIRFEDRLHTLPGWTSRQAPPASPCSGRTDGGTIRRTSGLE